MISDKTEEARADRKRQLNKAKRLFALIMFGCGLIMGVILVYKYTQNPELTQMQFLIEHFWDYVLSSFLVCCGLFATR